MNIILNEDKERVSVVREALKNNNGYCPCALFQTEDTKCMCREFREMTTPGYCRCKLYRKIED